MADSNTWDGIVNVFKTSPRYGFLLALAQVVVQSLIGVGGPSQQLIWHAVAFAVVLGLAVLFAALQVPPPPPPPTPPPEPLLPARAILKTELERSTQFILDGLVKERMHVDLTLLEYDAADHTAAFSIQVSYDITNSSSDKRKFTVHAQVECRGKTDETTRGHLLVTGEHLTMDKGFDFARVDPGASASIQDMFTLELPLPRGTYRVVWSCEKYHVRVPYAEFWATAHPLVRMDLTVDLRRVPGVLRAIADCYRSNPADFQRFDQGGKYTFTADGPFLPFQGIAIRVLAKP